ncbi:hypothetical protein VNO80_13716 [Phaseolus coccineus]|uniref:Pollen coat-like protein n=1 Tax=Phaseolus coccineus TaxID=3886 RepID=A0AAN9N284_PHACN
MLMTTTLAKQTLQQSPPNCLFTSETKMDSQNMSYNAGQAKGQAQEKASSMMDKASNVAQSAQDSMQQAGQQMQQKAQGAVDSVKSATGLNN